jgi:hypothetical protein
MGCPFFWFSFLWANKENERKKKTEPKESAPHVLAFGSTAVLAFSGGRLKLSSSSVHKDLS